MREVKFRIWDKKRNKWVGNFILSSEGDILRNDKLRFEGVHETEAELVQYTGKKDKNDKEIYEGDILSGDFPDVVFWDNDRGQWRLRNSVGFDDTLWEILRDNNPGIIGNMYENSELLKEEK